MFGGLLIVVLVALVCYLFLELYAFLMRTEDRLYLIDRSVQKLDRHLGSRVYISMADDHSPLAVSSGARVTEVTEVSPAIPDPAAGGARELSEVVEDPTESPTIVLPPSVSQLCQRPSTARPRISEGDDVYLDISVARHLSGEMEDEVLLESSDEL